MPMPHRQLSIESRLNQQARARALHLVASMASELIADLDNVIVDEGGREYFVNVAAEPVGSQWEAWLEFVPTDESEPLVTDTETSQASRDAVARWATTLDSVYLEGAFSRAVTAGTSVVRAPLTAPLAAAVALGEVASLDPFAVFAAHGKDGLKAQLRPLTRSELLTIIELYDLDPARLSLVRLSNLQLVTFIATAVEVQRKQGRR
jgi:hypothetical protein